jgi:RNA-directed DNA polymerase
MGRARAAPEKAVYAAPRSDEGWLRNVQRVLHQRSRTDLDFVFRKLWGFIVDLRTLRCALQRVARNRGRRTAGVDGVTMAKLVRNAGAERFVHDVRDALKLQSYRPSPVRRVLIPKPGSPGKYRALGIPTITDRVVQAAVKSILEPIFEADFFPVSYGFRPGRGVHGALEHLRMLLRPRPLDRSGEVENRLPYQWAVEGDIKGCFDNIDHHALMNRVRRRVGDSKVNRLVVAFLRAGVLAEDQFARTDTGTPQGGILSPLLANIALSAIEERYERHVWPRRTPTLRTDPQEITRRANERRTTDRRRGLPIVLPTRYADDFILLVGVPPGPDQQAQAERVAREEKTALAAFLKSELGLELAEAKTLVTPVTTPMRFLGHHVLVRRHPGHRRPVSASLVPRERSQLFREKIKRLFQKPSTGLSLRDQLRKLNPMLRGWANFYRHAWGAKKVFGALDHYVWWTIARWLRKKHRLSLQRLAVRYSWTKSGGRALRWYDGDTKLFEMSSVRVEQYKLGWMHEPYFATNIDGEPGA